MASKYVTLVAFAMEGLIAFPVLAPYKRIDANLRIISPDGTFDDDCKRGYTGKLIQMKRKKRV